MRGAEMHRKRKEKPPKWAWRTRFAAISSREPRNLKRSLDFCDAPAVMPGGDNLRPGLAPARIAYGTGRHRSLDVLACVEHRLFERCREHVDIHGLQLLERLCRTAQLEQGLRKVV